MREEATMEKKNNKGKAIRLDDDWDIFLNEHPELVIELKDGQVSNVIFPTDAENVTLVLLDNIPNNVYYIQYTLPGNSDPIEYTSPEARKSLLYQLLDL